MSTGRELSSDAQDASRFAPKWARDPQQNGSARRVARNDGDIWLGDAEEAARDDFRFREGDNALGLFRPPLEPTVIPDPWSASRGRGRRRLFVGLGLGLGSAAAGVAVATLALGMIARDPGSAGRESATRLAPLRSAPAAVENADRTRVPTGRLVVSMPTSPFPNDEVAPLGVAIYGTGPRGDVVIGGFAPGSTFSAGQALGSDLWVLSSSQIDGAVITPPSGFAGAMALLFELRLADGRVVDRKHARLEWSAPSPAVAASPPAAPPTLGASAAAPDTPPAAETSVRTLSAEEIAALLKRGNEMVSHGDLVGARLFFERAAQAGESRAALALASTYDPLVLEHLGERGLAPDITLARFWYEKAKELGSKEAPGRLQVLVSRSN